MHGCMDAWRLHGSIAQCQGQEEMSEVHRKLLTGLEG
jgi:hypothetical protein